MKLVDGGSHKTCWRHMKLEKIKIKIASFFFFLHTQNWCQGFTVTWIYNRGLYNSNYEHWLVCEPQYDLVQPHDFGNGYKMHHVWNFCGKKKSMHVKGFLTHGNLWPSLSSAIITYLWVLFFFWKKKAFSSSNLECQGCILIVSALQSKV